MSRMSLRDPSSLQKHRGFGDHVSEAIVCGKSERAVEGYIPHSS